ncbi:hypothetical protein E2562_010355 [Oryza meyeriana var. granulata]|uniref:Uncharacterized protein n=1 Tax=Oryza meyeriana var. granulata TaxID=110450 RepID=A0A6G1F6A5_9ORYZ|nr:hypothetical protein E2562_010355 [Oryza meyeriana var. granulata]
MAPAPFSSDMGGYPSRSAACPFLPSSTSPSLEPAVRRPRNVKDRGDVRISWLGSHRICGLRSQIRPHGGADGAGDGGSSRSVDGGGGRGFFLARGQR